MTARFSALLVLLLVGTANAGKITVRCRKPARFPMAPSGRVATHRTSRFSAAKQRRTNEIQVALVHPLHGSYLAYRAEPRTVAKTPMAMDSGRTPLGDQ